MGMQALGTGLAPGDASGLKSPQGLLGNMPFLFFKSLPSGRVQQKPTPELTTAENYPETSIPLGRGTQFTPQGAQPGVHLSCTAIAITQMLNNKLKKYINQD